jgi:hypothetical protein
MEPDVHLHRAAGVELCANLAEYIVPAAAALAPQEAEERLQILVERLGIGGFAFCLPFQADKFAIGIAAPFSV